MSKIELLKNAKKTDYTSVCVMSLRHFAILLDASSTLNFMKSCPKLPPTPSSNQLSVLSKHIIVICGRNDSGCHERVTIVNYASSSLA